MARPKVLVTRPIAQQALDMVAAETAMKLWTSELPPPRDWLLRELRDMDGLLSLLTEQVDRELLAAVHKLKVVSNMAVGYDNIDVAEATRRGIVVGNTPGVLTETTADLAFALLLAAGRRIAEADSYTRRGKWQTWGPMALLGQDIHDATLGIVGLGRIGVEVAKRALGFSMKVLYHDISRNTKIEQQLGIEYVPTLAELLSRADFVTIHVPLTSDTHHMIGQAQFAAMKPNAILVNAARGPIVDQRALYQALKEHRITGAAIDVTEVEPIPMDDPLLSLDNIVITPHIGSASVVTRTKMATMAAANLLAGVKGQLPPNCVNPEALERR